MNNKRLMKVLGLLLVLGLVAVFSPLTRAQARTIDMFSILDWTIDGLVVDDSGRPVISPQSGTPVIYPIPPQTTNELELLTFVVHATPGSLIIGTDLEYFLIEAPRGATLTETDNEHATFSWTPTETQGPNVYNFYVLVEETFGENRGWATTPVIVTVYEVNVAPVLAEIGDKSVAELDTLTFTATATDADIPVQTLVFSLAGEVPEGAVITTAGAFSWTPSEAQGPGEYTFDVCVSDSILSDCETITVTVNEVNVAPVANDMTETTTEDTAKAITLNVSDIDGDTLTAEILSNPTQGQVSVSGIVVTYTPNENYNGSDSFTYRVSDGELWSDSATVNITITPVNDAPVASDMTETTAEDTAKAITLNVSDIDGDTLTAEILSNPTHGEVSVSGLVVTYTPDADYNGPDSFTYKVSDGELESDTATVNITVTPVNDAPVASDMTETTAEDTAKAITANVSDIDGDALTAEILSNPTHGQVSVSGIVVTYTPDANYNGSDSFTYRVSDGELWSDTATVDITVTPVNDAPVAESFEVELQENGSMAFSLLASDVDGDTLTFSLVSGTAHGTLNCAGVNCTYTPNPHWFGMDSFFFKANDGLLDSNEATVTLNVIPLPRIYLPIIFR